MSLLKVAGLQKRYKARTVVHDVGFEVGSGAVSYTHLTLPTSDLV